MQLVAVAVAVVVVLLVFRCALFVTLGPCVLLCRRRKMTYADLGEDVKEGVGAGWQTPLDTKRSHTDASFLAVFSIFAGFWLVMGLYVFLVDDTIEIRYSSVLHHDEFFLLSSFLAENFYEARWPVLGLVSLSALLLLVFVAMFRWLTKPLVFITIFLTSSLLALLTVFLVSKVCVQPSAWPQLVLVSLVVAVYCVTLRSFKNVGTEPVCKVIRMSCKAMFFFPSTLLVTLLQFALYLLVIGFSVAVFLLLRTVRMPEHFDNLNMTGVQPAREDFDELWNAEDPLVSDQIIDLGLPPERILVFHLVNFCGGIWIYNFLDGLGRMILTATFATWYYTEDKTRISKFTVPRCISVILQYHLGTLAYGSSLFTILPMVYIIAKHARDKLKEMCKQPSCALSWLTLLAKFSFDALGMCAVHGTSFYKSAKDSYVLLMKNPLSFLTINFISECVILVGLLLLPIASFLAAMTYVCFDGGCETSMQSVHVTIMLVVTATSLLMSLTFFSVFRAASNTIRCCYLQDSKFSHEAEMDMYEIQVDDSKF